MDLIRKDLHPIEPRCIMLIEHNPVELKRRPGTLKEIIEERREARNWMDRLEQTIADLTAKLQTAETEERAWWCNHVIEQAKAKIEELKGELRHLYSRNPTIAVRPVRFDD